MKFEVGDRVIFHFRTMKVPAAGKGTVTECGDYDVEVQWDDIPSNKGDIYGIGEQHGECMMYAIQDIEHAEDPMARLARRKRREAKQKRIARAYRKRVELEK